jgi:hypothetical protein
MAEKQADSSSLAERIRALRLECFGEHGGPLLARRLRIPQRRLARIEAGVPFSAHLLERLMEITHVNPAWLLTGEGERYRRPARSTPGEGQPGPRTFE